jgi:hypothetical protein
MPNSQRAQLDPTLTREPSNSPRSPTHPCSRIRPPHKHPLLTKPHPKTPLPRATSPNLAQTRTRRIGDFAETLSLSYLDFRTSWGVGVKDPERRSLPSATHAALHSKSRRPDDRCRPRIHASAGGGKSELRRAVCRITSGTEVSRPLDGQCNREHTAKFGGASQRKVRVKRCGKSAPVDA